MSLIGQDDPRDSGLHQSPLYVPILKGRLGESRALEMMNPLTRERSYPLVEIVPDAEMKPHEPGALMRWFGQLALKWAGRVMVDGSYLTGLETAGATGLRTVMDAARGPFQLAVPVLRLADDDPVRADAAAAVRQDHNGVAVRIQREDMFANPAMVARRLQDLLWDLRMAPEEVDLVLDLAHLRDDAAAMHAARLADQVLSELADIDKYRTVVLASGAFPMDLRNVSAWTMTEQSRHDAALYEYLRARHPSRVPTFGDYAVTHPKMVALPVSGFPAPQLRYAVASRWLILRGTRGDLRGNSQFYDVCQQISRHPQFCGPDLGEADRWIADSKQFGPGNSWIWRAVGTAHHADFVIDSLTKLALP
jgi:hypothetical protein